MQRKKSTGKNAGTAFSRNQSIVNIGSTAATNQFPAEIPARRGRSFTTEKLVSLPIVKKNTKTSSKSGMQKRPTSSNYVVPGSFNIRFDEPQPALAMMSRKSSSRRMIREPTNQTWAEDRSASFGGHT